MRAFIFTTTRIRAAGLLVVLAASWLLPSSQAADFVNYPDLGLRLQRGFRVSLYADSGLANDIYAMTLDARGRVVVTSAGYIKTLLDTDGNGVADSAKIFATPAQGGMGLCFDGTSLFYSGDGWLSRYDDRNGDGQADGPPENLFPLGLGEHGGHAIRKGPDGWWHLIGGNDTGFDRRHVTLAGSPVRDVEAGALLRISPNGKNSEVVAHGFRNPYDFDFNFAGELFTYDSDKESDLFLPWNSPTRLYQIGHGQHHGWRLNGFKRSWARPDYYADTVNILWNIGRGSPTGVTSYRHTQFPPRYRDGLFALDWTFGRVIFTPLQADGAGYVASPEIFMEPLGTHGFAPTDLVVAPDGALYVASGGRKTRGAVYRIDFPGPTPLLDPATPNPNLNVILQSPQPLDAWSRAFWVPAALSLGAGPFVQTVLEEQVAPAWRVRAVEILTELYGGLPPACAVGGARAGLPLVRARVAWSLGRVPSSNAGPLLAGLATDLHPLVRRCALEALGDRPTLLAGPELARVLAANFGYFDKRVRQAAARLASRLPEPAWQILAKDIKRAAPNARLTGVLAQIWRHPDVTIHPDALDTLAPVLAQAREPQTRLNAVRLVILALGDWRLNNPSVEVYTGYEPAFAIAGNEAVVEKIARLVRPMLPSGQVELDLEASRLLAMIEDADAKTPAALAGYLTDRSAATSDFHYLTCLSRLRATSPGQTVKIAHTILSLDHKLGGETTHTKQSWSLRLAELTQIFLRRDPALGDALLKHPQFAAPGHVGLALTLGKDRQPAAARLFQAAMQKNLNVAWPGQIIELLATLPPEEARPILRRQWVNIVLRDELLLRLSAKPEPLDRDKFLFGLSSSQPGVVRASLTALQQLPRDPVATNLIAPLTLLRRLLAQPDEQLLRAQLVTLLTTNTGQPFKVQEQGTDAASMKRAYQPVFDWVAARFPHVLKALDAADAEDPVRWNFVLKSVPWDKGVAERGGRIFSERGCQTCHLGASALGPDLNGAAARFSAEDLFNAIIFPSRDVAGPYRTVLVHTRDQQTYNGSVVYESAEGVILQINATSTVRLGRPDIVSREPSNLSLMPAGLLNGLTPQGLADLNAFLRSLQPRQ